MKKVWSALLVLMLLCGSLFAAVNINKANESELSKLKGIGGAKAKAIVEYRTKNGAFKSVDDLAKVNGIGPKILENIKKEITVEDGAAAAVPTKK